MKPTDDWQPVAAREYLEARARLLRDIRDYFFERGVLEVETPLLSMAGNTDPQIQSIRTGGNGYLRTSPEFALKRMLAAGSGDIYELGRVFRAAESGRFHNPEFTLLEWYRTACSYHRLMDEVATLVRRCGRGKFDHWTETRLTYRALFQQHLGLDPFTAEPTALSDAAKQHGFSEIVLDRSQWLDLLISSVIQPALPRESLTFVYDFPTHQAALAQIRPGMPAVAERFELYLGQVEIANGYQELTDVAEQRSRFEHQNTQRKEQGEPVYAIDERLLNAIENGLPECAGVALGADRLLMVICGVEKIDEVLAFPSSRA